MAAAAAGAARSGLARALRCTAQASAHAHASCCNGAGSLETAPRALVRGSTRIAACVMRCVYGLCPLLTSKMHPFTLSLCSLLARGRECTTTMNADELYTALGGNCTSTTSAARVPLYPPERAGLQGHGDQAKAQQRRRLRLGLQQQQLWHRCLYNSCGRAVRARSYIEIHTEASISQSQRASPVDRDEKVLVSCLCYARATSSDQVEHRVQRL